MSKGGSLLIRFDWAKDMWSTLVLFFGMDRFLAQMVNVLMALWKGICPLAASWGEFLVWLPETWIDGTPPNLCTSYN